MLPRAPMPFWHIVKVVCSSVYQTKMLLGVSLVCHLIHPDEFAPLTVKNKN